MTIHVYYTKHTLIFATNCNIQEGILLKLTSWANVTFTTQNKINAIEFHAGKIPLKPELLQLHPGE